MLPLFGAWLLILTIPLSVVAAGLVLVIGPSQQGLRHALVGSVLGLGAARWGWALWAEKGVAVAEVPAL